MSELSGDTSAAACEVLNTPYEELLDLSADIGSDRDSLRTYVENMRRLSPGLAKQIGGWIGVLRESIPQHGVVVATRAEGAFTAGSSMMYELLRRSAERSGQPIPDADFISDNLVDDELSEERPQLLIELAFRGEKLFRDHKPLFDVALNMFCRSNGGRDTNEVMIMLFAAPNPTDVFSFDLVHYLNGAAETVLPLERRARVMALEEVRLSPSVKINEDEALQSEGN